MACDTPYLQNEFGGPLFTYVFNLILSFSTCSQSLKKIYNWELLGANVLKSCVQISSCKRRGGLGEFKILVQSGKTQVRVYLMNT